MTPTISSNVGQQAALPGNMAITNKQDIKKRVLAGAPVYKETRITAFYFEMN